MEKIIARLNNALSHSDVFVNLRIIMGTKEMDKKRTK